MNDPDLNQHDEKLTRWIDDTLSPADRAEWECSLSDPGQGRAADQEKQAADSVRRLLREHVPAVVEPPYPDFFNSQILKKVREEQLRESTAGERAGAGWLGWLRRPWLPGLAAAAAVLAMLSYVNVRPGDSGTRVISVYSPEPNATATAVVSREAGAVIIDVQGLEDYPNDRQVVGRRTDETGALLATLTR